MSIVVRGHSRLFIIIPSGSVYGRFEEHIMNVGEVIPK